MENVENADNVDKLINSKHMPGYNALNSKHEKPKTDKKSNCTEQNDILTRSFSYVQNGKVSKRIHTLDNDNPLLISSDMEEKILKENPFAELKTEIDVINGIHSFASSVITENNDLEFVFNMQNDIKKESNKCSICNKVFYKETMFINHMKYHNAPKKSTNKCTSCGCNETFNHQRELANKKNKAVHYSTKPFKCSVCQILF